MSIGWPIHVRMYGQHIIMCMGKNTCMYGTEHSNVELSLIIIIYTATSKHVMQSPTITYVL